MSQIIDWEYYSSHFPNIIPQNSFESVEAQAELELFRVIPSYLLNELSDANKQNTVFHLCNFFYSNKAVLSGKSVTSVNNNGYSESYSIQTADQAQDAMNDLIYKYTGIRLAGAF